MHLDFLLTMAELTYGYLIHTRNRGWLFIGWLRVCLLECWAIAGPHKAEMFASIVHICNGLSYAAYNVLRLVHIMRVMIAKTKISAEWEPDFSAWGRSKLLLKKFKLCWLTYKAKLFTISWINYHDENLDPTGVLLQPILQSKVSVTADTVSSGGH